MSTSPAAQRVERVLLVLVAAFLVVAVGFALANYNSGPVGKVKGTVLSTRGIQSDTDATTQQITLRLTTGEVVFARTVPGVVADNGDIAFANSYRQALTGNPSYEVFRVERGQ
jgi:hypothetical protein